MVAAAGGTDRRKLHIGDVTMRSLYEEVADVVYSKIATTKDIMKELGRRTAQLPLRHGVQVIPRPHSAKFLYVGDQPFHGFNETLEGLGHKNIVAELMYILTRDGMSRHDKIMVCNALMAVNDLVADGSMAFMYMDHIAAGDSDWFDDARRAAQGAAGLESLCLEIGMCLGGGESPVLKRLVNSKPLVKSAPVLSGVATGVYYGPYRPLEGVVHAHDAIIGFGSSGVHSNGSGLVIDLAEKLPDGFLTRLPNGNTFGDEFLTPTRCYVRLVAALAEEGIYVNKFLPGTGGGVAKLASYSERDFTYEIVQWPEWGAIFEFLHRICGVSMYDMLRTFNCGIGYYAFVHPHQATRVIDVARRAGYPAWLVGRATPGKRHVVFGPAGDVKLPPPEE
jgi:phosphoribosylformylglycinamidine cyclo-ligase